MLDDGKTSSLIDFFLTRADLATLDNALARALCYWPVYCSILDRVRCDESAQDRIRRWIESIKLNEVCKFAPSKTAPADDASTQESNQYVRWPVVLAILLGASCSLRVSNIEALSELVSGTSRLPTGTARYGFYYSFAAAFQRWISVHLESPPQHWTDAVAEVCKDCRARIEADDPARQIIDFFYDDVLKTRAAFRAVFGVCAKDIALLVTDDTDDAVTKAIGRAADVHLTSPFLAPPANGHPLPYGRSEDSRIRKLWGELIWFMWEIEDLAFVRSNVADHERTVHEYLSMNDQARSGADKSDTESVKAVHAAWDRLFHEVIYPNLRPFQFTLFVRASVSDGDDKDGNKIQFDTHLNLRDFGIKLPENEVWDKFWNEESGRKAVRRLGEIVGKLYEKGFPKEFFSRLQMAKLSSADPSQTFPFILFPDGEISFYYALDVAERKKSKIKNLLLKRVATVAADASVIAAISAKNGELSREAIWEWGGMPHGLLPREQEFPLHHRCAALVGAARMLLDEVKGNTFGKQAAGRVLDIFCKQGEPKAYLDGLLNDPVFAKSTTIEVGPRIEWEQEVMLRRDDPQCHTLFFLPIGNDKFGVPTAMIAGTLRGVEVRWMPFSSKRMVSYLLPLAYILRPLLDRMVHRVFLDKALKAARAEKEEDFRRTLESNVRNLFEQIDEISRSAARIQAEVSPAPIRFFAAHSRAIDRLFADGESTKIDETILTDWGLKPGDELAKLSPVVSPSGAGETQRWDYIAVHGSSDDNDGLPEIHKIKTTKALVLAAASVMQGNSLRNSFFRALWQEISSEDAADGVFRMLKRMLHRHHSYRDRTIAIGDLLVLLRLCALEADQRKGNLEISYDGLPIELGASWLTVWRMPPSDWKFVIGRPATSTTGADVARPMPVTPAAFLGAVARLLSEEMKIRVEGGDRADIRTVKVRVVDQTLEIRMDGNHHLPETQAWRAVDDNGKDRGLTSAFAIFEAAVGHLPSFIRTRDEAVLDGIDVPFVICDSTRILDNGVTGEFVSIRLSFPIQSVAKQGAGDHGGDGH